MTRTVALPVTVTATGTVTPAPAGVVLLALLDRTATLGSALTAASAGRYHWTTELSPDADVVVVEPRPAAAIEALAGAVRVPIMVIDLADRCTATDIAACLEAGADAFVRARNPALVLAHLDALARWARRVGS
jgi:hypothetical protein